MRPLFWALSKRTKSAFTLGEHGATVTTMSTQDTPRDTTSRIDRAQLLADQDDCLLAITAGKPIPSDRLRRLPPWRAVMIARVAAKAGITVGDGSTAESLVGETLALNGAAHLAAVQDVPTSSCGLLYLVYEHEPTDNEVVGVYDNADAAHEHSRRIGGDIAGHRLNEGTAE